MTNFRLGLSSNTIESGLIGQHVDGMGVYTQHLIQHFEKSPEIKLDLFAYPRWLRKAPPSDYLNGHFWPASFSSASLFSACLQRPLFKPAIDIFHATDYRIPRLHCPVIATLHDAISLQHPEWTRAQGRFIKNWILHTAAQWADHIIAISQAAVPDLANYFDISPEKITVIHCGVDERWLEKLAMDFLQKIRATYHLPLNYFLFVGTLQPRKNIARIVQAFQRLPSELRQQYPLVIVGREGWGMEEVLPLLQKLIEKNQALWLTQIDDELTLRAIYQNATAFVFPTLYEGFGIPILEACASGIPVLTSNISALPEVAGDAALLVNPHNSEEIAHGMQQLITDVNLRKQLILKGQQRAKEKTWTACAQATIEVYRRFI